MRLSRLVAVLIAAASVASAAPPDFYQRIGHLVWLVRSVDGPLHAWPALGLADVHDFGKVGFKGEYRGRPMAGRVHLAWGHLGGLAVDLVEPQDGDTAFNAFLAAHGDGVFSIVFAVASEDEMAREAARLSGAGIGALQRLRLDTDRGTAVFTFFDTEPRGKYVLGLVYWPGGAPPAAAPSIVSHVAFVIREAKPVKIRAITKCLCCCPSMSAGTNTLSRLSNGSFRRSSRPTVMPIF